MSTSFRRQEVGISSPEIPPRASNVRCTIAAFERSAKGQKAGCPPLSGVHRMADIHLSNHGRSAKCSLSAIGFNYHYLTEECANKC